jgi:putative cell wall-binding protein
VAPTVLNTASTLGAAGTVLSFTVTQAPFTVLPLTSTTAFWTLSGASVNLVNATAGSVVVNVVEGHSVTTDATPPVTTTTYFDMFTGVSVGTVTGNTTTIFGPDGTADGTVAAEFENAYPSNAAANEYGNVNAVLATDAAHTNGSDALAASYLEGTLHTGLLITSPTSLGLDAQEAMRVSGVSTVYVVGGPLAISPTVIAQIEALPAYNAGGLTTTGSNVKVVGPIAGTDGTAEGTAAMIAQYFGTNYGAGSFPLAYTTAGGAYNDTLGNASTVAPPGSVALPTAFVIASSDWQDAMSIAPEAFARRFPVILTGPSTQTTLGTNAQTALTALGVKQVIIIGGQLALQNTVETQIAALNGGIPVLRIAGIDATDTAAKIANFAWSTAGNNSGLGWTAASGLDKVLASHVDYWSDALGAAPLGGGANPGTFGFEPILLTESPLVIGSYTTTELGVAGGLGVTNLNVLGGPLAMPASTVSTMLAAL